MNDLTWLDWLSALGAILTPVLLLGLGALGWLFRSSLERRHELEDALREDRLQTYDTILEPFVLLFTPAEGLQRRKEYRNKGSEDIAKDLLFSPEHRRASFRMALFADDDVVKAYNDLMQFFFSRKGEKLDPEGSWRVMDLFGAFLLEIRRSVGNEGTDLNGADMLEWLLTDIRQKRIQGGAPVSAGRAS